MTEHVVDAFLAEIIGGAQHKLHRFFRIEGGEQVHKEREAAGDRGSGEGRATFLDKLVTDTGRVHVNAERNQAVLFCHTASFGKVSNVVIGIDRTDGKKQTVKIGIDSKTSRKLGIRAAGIASRSNNDHPILSRSLDRLPAWSILFRTTLTQIDDVGAVIRGIVDPGSVLRLIAKTGLSGKEPELTGANRSDHSSSNSARIVFIIRFEKLHILSIRNEKSNVLLYQGFFNFFS